MAKIIGTVKSITGKASVTRGGNQVHTLKKGEALHENDIIQTLQAGAKVVLTLEGGRELTLNGNDQILLDESVFAVLEEGEVIDGKALHQLIADKLGNPEETAAGETSTSESNAGAEFAQRNDARGSTDSDGTLSQRDSSALSVNFNAVENENFAPEAFDDTAVAIEEGSGDDYSAPVVATGNVLDNDTDDQLPNPPADLDVTAVISNDTENPTNFAEGNFIIEGKYGTLVLNSETGAYTYTANDQNPDVDGLSIGDSLSESFSYTVSDGGLDDSAVLTITINGSNDQPIVTNSTEAGALIEDRITEVTGVVSFVDVDLKDTHSISSERTSQETDYPVTMGAFNAVKTTDTTGTGTGGSVSWTYTLDNDAAQELAYGQEITEVYTITIKDNNGAVTTQTIAITIIGTNDTPTINAEEVSSGALTEASSTADLIATSTFTFADLDTTDTHTVTSAFKSGTYTDQNGNVLSQLEVGSITSLTVSDNATDDNAGEVTWEYTVNDAAVQYLAAGETVELVYTVTVSDNQGASVNKDIAITITGTNDQPVVSDVNANGTGTSFIGFDELTTVQGESLYLNGSRNWGQAFVAEDSSLSKIQLNIYDTTNNNMDAQARIVIMSADNFINDSQTIWQPTTFSGSIVYDETISLLFGADHIVTVDTHSLDLTLGGQYYIVVYPVSGDNFNIYLSQGGTTGDGVALTEINNTQSGSGYIHGTYNLGIALTYGNGATVILETNTTQTISPEHTLRELSGLTDLDTTDTHTFQLATDTLPEVTTDSGAIITDLQVEITDESTGAYSISGNFDALAEGEIATVTFQYVANDGKGFDGTDGINESSTSAPKTVTLTVTGTNDVPVISDTSIVSSEAKESSTLGDGSIVAGTVASGILVSTDVDHGATATWSGNATGIYGSFVINPSTGAWTYTIDDTSGSAADKLFEGETKTETFTATVTDDKGATATQEVTITVIGSNDAPVAINDIQEADFDTYTVNLGGTNWSGAVITATGGNPVFSGNKLGVKGNNPDSNNIDNSGQKESVQFTFTNNVLLNQATVVLSDFNTSLLDRDTVEWSVYNGTKFIASGKLTPSDHTSTLLIDTGTQFFNTLTIGTPTNASSSDFLITSVKGYGLVINPDLTVTENQSITIDESFLLSNDSDVDSTMLNITEIDTSGTIGIVTMNADGNVTYDPAGRFDHLNAGEIATDTFTYILSDGDLTDTATVTVNIIGTTSLYDSHESPNFIDLLFMGYDGGEGYDSVTLPNITNFINVDFDDLSSLLHNIENLNLEGGHKTLTNITPNNVANMTDSNHVLKISGEADDTLELSGFSRDDATSNALAGYDVYTGTSNGTEVTLHIDEHITNINIIP